MSYLVHLFVSPEHTSNTHLERYKEVSYLQYIHTYIHKYIHTHIHTYIHTYIDTYLLIGLQVRKGKVKKSIVMFFSSCNCVLREKKVHV